MVDSRIVDYAREQLSAGFSEEQVIRALVGQGWSDGEANEAVSIARGPEKPKVIKAGEKAIIGFIVTLVGGIIMFLGGIESGISTPLLSLVFDNITNALGFSDGVITGFLSLGGMTWITNLVLGAVIIILSVLIYIKPKGTTLGGIGVIAISIITLLFLESSTVFIGSIVCIIGGILNIIRK